MSAGFHLTESSQKQTGPVMDKVDTTALGTHLLCLPPGNLEAQHTNLGAGFTSNVNINGPRSSDGGISSQNSLGASWEDILKQSLAVSDGLSSNASLSSSRPVTTGMIGQENLILSDLLEGDTAIKQSFDSSVTFQPNWQVHFQFIFIDYVLLVVKCIKGCLNVWKAFCFKLLSLDYYAKLVLLSRLLVKAIHYTHLPGLWTILWIWIWLTSHILDSSSK